jgi:hypothetical protein
MIVNVEYLLRSGLEMSTVSVSEARSFLRAIDLPPPPGSALEDAPAFDFDAIKNQAMVVGSDIISFVRGVTPERRADIVRSSLLAQLAAKRNLSNPADLYS